MTTRDPLRQPCRATTARPKLPQIVWYTVTGTVELLLIKYRADARKSGGGARFTDNEVTLVIDGRSHILSVTAQRMPDGMILLEMAPMDNQRRLSQEQLQHAQQVAARDLVRGTAHEIKNPLGGLRGAAQLLSKALPDPSLLEYTKVIIEQADRLRNLVDRLLGPQLPGTRVTESIHKVAERVVTLVSMELPDNVRLIRDYDPSLPELAHDPDQIEQVLLNIVRNALQALGPEGGEIILRTRTAFQLTLHGERYRLAARIDVEDNGPGIPPHLQDTLFYPMVSGREGGTGLGLSIARNLIDQHSGKIEFTSWRGIPSSRFTCLSGNKGDVYATRDSLGSR